MRGDKDARAWDNEVCELRPCVQAGLLTTQEHHALEAPPLAALPCRVSGWSR
jgi:hypothetical protein